jgi:hypothetical protein
VVEVLRAVLVEALVNVGQKFWRQWVFAKTSGGTSSQDTALGFILRLLNGKVVQR